MRNTILEHFPAPPTKKISNKLYLKNVKDIYVTDAYHSLSIEGYRVSPELIQRVQDGKWNPDEIESDKTHKDALAARGYWQAFQAVEKSLQKVLDNMNSGKVAASDHRIWYREMFSPNITAGLLKPADLAGYRNSQVYIRHSKHVPPNYTAARDLMPAFFELLENESESAVRIVLGHFFFVYIHPYMDGNGRLGRFLMNVMLASGNYPWVVVPYEKRKKYMAALEAASTQQNIKPFRDFIADLINSHAQSDK
jgi:Fic family protein